MLKGRTTIQLRNAKTGEIEQEVTEENLVTNAVQNMMSLPYWLRISSSISSTDYYYSSNWEPKILRSNYPIYKTAYGCITLFADTHEENVDKVLPDATNKIIGFAGSFTEKEIESNLLCGEFNSTESKALDNGYHFVWDFDSEKANGTFKSVSLGANDLSKYDNTNSDYSSFMSYSFKTTTSDTSMICTNISPYDTNVPTKPDGDSSDIKRSILKLETDESGENWTSYVLCYTYKNYCIYKYDIQPINVRSLTQETLIKIKKSEPLVDWTAFTGTDTHPISNNVVFNVLVHMENDLINMFYIPLKDYNTTQEENQFIHEQYDFNGQKKFTKKINMPYSINYYMRPYSSSPAFMLGDKYYMTYYNAEDNNLYLVSFSESGVEDKKSLLGNVGSDIRGNSIANLLYNGNGYLIFNVRYSSSLPWYDKLYILNNIDTEPTIVVVTSTNFYRYTNIISHNFKNVKPPFELYSYDNSGMGKAQILCAPSIYYLGTINNLEKSITKTDAQTMKIIYDLTEEAEE